MKPATFYLLSAILLLAMIACSNTDEPIIDEELLGVVWKVDSLQTPDVKVLRGPDTLITIIQLNNTTRVNCPTPPNDTPMTIRLDEEMRISGALICNDYGGSYEIAENERLAIEVLHWNESACGTDPLCHWLEDVYRNALENATAYEVAENRLILYDSSRHHVVNFTGE